MSNSMSHRIAAAVLIAMFAFLLFLIVKDTLHLLEGGQYGEVPLLLSCAVVCAAWMAFLSALALAGAPESRVRWDQPPSHA